MKTQLETIMDIYNFFEIAFKYPLPEIIQDKPGRIIELGGGKNPVSWVNEHYDLPEWDADNNPIPVDDNSVDTLYAMYILEHIDRPIKLIREIDRVLKPGGHANIVVPHAMAPMAFDDPDHRSFWIEKSWRAMFDNPYYEKNAKEWNLKVHTCFIMAAKFENLSLFTQVVKKDV